MKLFNKLIKSPFIKNVIIMTIGAIGAQAITMGLSPIITRLYGPESFGILGTFTAITSTITTIAALTYPIAIVLPKNDENAKGLIKLSLLITLVISFISLILLFLFHPSIVSIFNLKKISIYLYFIPIIIIFAGLLQVSQQWIIRTNQFKLNAKVDFIQSILINGSKVGLGLIYPVASVLVFFQVISDGLRSLMLIMFTKKTKNKFRQKSKENIHSIKELAKIYFDFPLYRAPEVLLNSFSQTMPILLLASLFGPASTGFYTIARSVLGLPSSIIGQAIGDVFYPRISKAANENENLSYLIKKATLLLIIIGIFPFGIVFVFGPSLFELVFGAGWGTAGEYARWIALLSFSVFINKPSIRSIPVLNAQRFHLIYSVINLLVSSLALIVGFLVFNNDIIAIALFGVFGMVLNTILILIILKMSNLHSKNN